MEKTEKKVSIILLIIVLAVAAFLSLATFFTDLLWFKEMEYLSVFFKQLVTMLEVGIPTFVVVTLLAHLYLSRLRKGYFDQVASSEDTNMKSLKVTSNILSIVYGLAIAGVTAVKLWFNVLQFANSSDFGVQDPIFGLDVSIGLFFLYICGICSEGSYNNCYSRGYIEDNIEDIMKANQIFLISILILNCNARMLLLNYM